ncbi:hypothetical protein T439DRAFT_357080 [Meredithblackwellia eburnea MCA 4105]
MTGSENLYIGLAVAEFDYAATTDDEIDIVEGQLLWVLENDDKEWWKVKCKSESPNPPIGLVPASYLTPPPVLRTVHALYDYEPSRNDEGIMDNEEELAIQEGQSLQLIEEEGEWALVLDGHNQKVGFVPATYIEDGDAPTEGAILQEQEEEEEEEEDVPAAPTAYVDPSERVAAAKAATKASDVKTWSVTEMDKKKKKKKGTLGVGNGAIFFASESDKNPVQQYPLSTLQSLSTEKSKHLLLTFPTSGELHFVIGTKDAFDEILAKIEEGRGGSTAASTGASTSTPSAAVAPPPPPPPPPPAPPAPTVTATPRTVPPSISSALPPPPIRSASSTASVPRAVPAQSSSSKTNNGDSVALYDFLGEQDDELTVSEGDRLVFIEGGSDDPDWVKVRKVGDDKEGVVPASYVERDEGEGAQAQEEDEEEDDGEEERARQEAEAAEAAAAAADAAKLKKQLETDRAAAAARAKEKERARAEREQQKRREREQEAAQRKARHPKADPIPVPTMKDLSIEDDEPPRLTPRPSNKSAPKGDAGGKTMPNPAKVRTWKDRSGQFKVDAEFLGITGNKIRLHKTNGVTIEVPIEKMSSEDKAFLKRLTSGETVDDNKSLGAARDEQRRRAEREERHRQRDVAASNTNGGSRSRDASAHPPKQQRKPVDWLELFLGAGCELDDSTRYERNFEREKMDENVLPELEAGNLRTLGLREGDIIRVLKYIKEKYGPPPTPDKSDRDARNAADAALARQMRQPTPPPPNLFTSPDGTLKTRRGRPNNANRQGSTAVDSDALGAAANKLAAERATTPPIARIASPSTTKDPIDKRSSSTIPIASAGSFDDDAWAVKDTPKPVTPSPAPAPAPPPAPAPVAVVPTPPPAPPAPTPPVAAAPEQRSNSTDTSQLTYNDGLLAQIANIAANRPPSAPVPGTLNHSFGGASIGSSPSPVQAFNPNAPRGPIAPIAANQQLLAPLIPTPTGFRPQPQFSQAPLMPNVTGFVSQAPMVPSFTGMAPQAGFGLAPPLGMQPTGSPNFLQQPVTSQPQFVQAQPTGFMQPQPTGFIQPQQTGFVQPQATGFQPQQPQGSTYNQVPGRFSPAQPVQFNPMPPQTPTTSSSTSQFEAKNVFASMKDGSFTTGSGASGPQNATKYDALRPQPTGMQFAQNGFPQGLQPQATGFNPSMTMQPQMTGFNPQPSIFPQQTGYGQGFQRQVR